MAPCHTVSGMPLTLTVDPSQSSAPFRQIQRAVVQGVASGELQPGERLPTTRALATQLGVAVNTVASAYRALEQDGVIEGRGRAGTFVSLGEDPVTAAAREIALDAARRLRDLGLDTARSREVLTDAVDVAQLAD